MARTKTKIKPGPKPKKPTIEVGTTNPAKEDKAPEQVTIQLPDGQPLGISIKANANGIAIGIRYGHGSQDMPLFGITPSPKPSQVGVQGGGDGGEPTCP
jgi:hypothetical protein